VAILPPLPADVLTAKGHVFPVVGRYDFGGAGAGFGSGRAGHSHQGHDVFARCGTPMVAARGGRIQANRYHHAAGHYVVIDATGTGTDYVYMHLARRSPFRRGDKVATGQRIGAVGDSGNARGCHLHFELGSAPGYYEGGRPFDPLPALKAWRR
jgi:murein DD-endopeptidase MepM/ murein hydrolase activator NlpD